MTLRNAVPAGAPVLLDSSVVIAYLRGVEEASPAARAVVDGSIGSGRNVGLISAASVMEVLTGAVRSGDRARRVAVDFMCAFPNMKIVVIDSVVGQVAANLRLVGGLDPPDALVVASAVVAGARHLVTNDATWGPRLARAWPEATVVALSEVAAG